jgi:ParB-like chromosome segregation protein Spo0J
VAAFPISGIRIGRRHRRDLGDIAALASNIAEVGLLHPLVVTPDGTLIAGERRLRAVQRLGWTEVPVTIVDLDDIVRGELARKTPNERTSYRAKSRPSAAPSDRVAGRLVARAA